MSVAYRSCLLLVLFSLISFSSAWAGEKTWIEVRSEHFRVISDGDNKGALDIAREFEQMRAVFAAGAVNMRLDTGAPLLILAPRNAGSMAEVMSWPAPSEMVGGLFEQGWEKQFAVVRTDQDRPGFYQPAFHEYVHTLLHSNFHWLPTWLDEGLAEFYGTAEFKEKTALVGEPSLRKYIFDREKLIPLKTLLAVDQHSPYYHEGNKVSIFYAEAWGLTHYLTFGDGMERGHKLGQFYTLLENGVDQEKAFEQVFGSLDDVQDKLEKYVHKGKMHAWEFENPPQILERNFKVRTLTPAEAKTELGCHAVWGSHNYKVARQLLVDALKQDPKLAAAHEAMAFLNFDEGKDEDALRELKVTLQQDDRNYLALFAQTMLSPEAHSADPGDQTRVENALLHVLTLNPQFAPAYVQLGFLYTRKGDLKKAVAAMSKASQLEPSRAGYELALAKLLAQIGRPRDAGSIAKYIADRWVGSDHDEAVEVWNLVPLDQRTELKQVTAKFEDGVQEIQGIVKASACAEEGTDRRATLTISKGGKDMLFQPTKRFRAGFSDTIWYGRDHFSPCHHIEGLRAVVRFKPGDGKGPNDIQELQVRVDLPVTPSQGSSPSKVAEKQ